MNDLQTTGSADIAALMEKALALGGDGVAALERLEQMYERAEAKAARRAFTAALSDVRSALRRDMAALY